MFKKVSIVTALSATLLFGGAFQNTADASAQSGNHQNQANQTYQTHYVVNGNWNFQNNQDFNNFLNRFFKQYKPEQKQPDTNEKPDTNKKTETNKKPTANQNKNVTQTPAKQESQTPAQKPVQKEQPSSNSAIEGLSQYEQQVVDLTNQERANHGLAPLKADKELSRVAREKSRDMRANQYFDHNSPVYGSPFDMMKSYGIHYSTAGENIAKGQRTPQEVVDAWMNSAGHRANILNGNFTHIGVGYVEQGNYWTQQFIGK
ncbi:putative membrane protein YlbC [Lentibacillus sp. JNUCC-1]|uniref:CAP domain-containing protein n=1 Tax=Lentibacillus sp. JNUCC-1 TaxID=2654513 RepID=UPI0012E7E392|nr:CAP domain-containing protein [Lentibacillus sp. JNUCC-1]MUV36935.1 putative membrane protein YlbC [Lentibacillus sp. JNUCC-1]